MTVTEHVFMVLDPNTYGKARLFVFFNNCLGDN